MLQFWLAIVATVWAFCLVLVGEPRSSEVSPTRPLRIDPNTAALPVLSALSRVGPSMAGRIVMEREKRPFRSLDDLDDRVQGFGPATREAIRPFLRFGESQELSP